MTRYIDPHMDPLRAPSRAGHHPHLVPEHASRVNPQDMYERRDQMAQYRPVQRMPQPVGQVQPPQQSGFWMMVGVFSLGALAVYLGFKAAEDREQPRRNPDESGGGQPLLPAPTQVVVVPGAVQAAPVASQTILPVSQIQPAPAGFSLAEGVKHVAPTEATAPAASKKKPKRKHPRRTSQARGDDGKYLPAGTRKRKITEGHSKKEK